MRIQTEELNINTETNLRESMYSLAFGIWYNMFLLHRHCTVQLINQNKFLQTHFSSNTDCPQPISLEVVGLFNDILVKFPCTQESSVTPCHEAGSSAI